jgi:hypothetical protein
VGTAGLPADVTENGSVAVGTGVFIHDGHPKENPNNLSQWRDERFDRLLSSALERQRFEKITALDVSIADRFLPPPLNPSWRPRVLARYDFVSLGTVNVTNDSEYQSLDPQTVAAFNSSNSAGTPISVETTHGLIRAQSDAPFLFVSAIVNRLGQFAVETNPRFFAQNTAAAANAGVALGWMLPNIVAALSDADSDHANAPAAH